jgi:hypothetical protein
MAFLGMLGGPGDIRDSSGGGGGMGTLLFDDIVLLSSSNEDAVYGGGAYEEAEEVGMFLFEGGLVVCRFGSESEGSAAYGHPSQQGSQSRRYPVNEWEYGYGFQKLLHASSAFSGDQDHHQHQHQHKAPLKVKAKTHSRAQSRASRYGYVAAMTVINVIRREELTKGLVRVFQSQSESLPSRRKLFCYQVSEVCMN